MDRSKSNKRLSYSRYLEWEMEMKEKKLNSWEEFETEVSAILADLEKKRNETPIYVSSPLFRGHSKESWKLKTTLERYSNKHYSITDYYRILRAIEPAVASFTSRKMEY